MLTIEKELRRAGAGAAAGGIPADGRAGGTNDFPLPARGLTINILQ